MQVTSTELTPQPYVVSVIHGDQTILLDAQNGHYYTLNAVGGDIWSALCAGESRKTIAIKVATKYGADPERVASDVQRLYESLMDASLAVSR